MKNTVITIAREFGSGGREIGLKLSEKLGFAFYDKEILKMVADNGGLSEDFVAANEEKAPQIIAPSFGRIMIDTYYQPSFSDTIFIQQSRLIKDLAEKGNCVIVGRCADYILRDCAFKIFVSATDEYKIAHKKNVAPEKADYTDEQMLKYIKDVEKKRSKYYEHYTGRRKGIAANYDLCLSMGKLDVDDAVKMILSVME